MKEVKTPRMSRMHYEYIAQIIRNMEFKENTTIAPKEYVATVFTDALRYTSVNFKREKFFDSALGLTKAPKPAKSKKGRIKSKDNAGQYPRRVA